MLRVDSNIQLSSLDYRCVGGAVDERGLLVETGLRGDSARS